MFLEYLSFSDTAKFALIAKNIVLGNGFTTDFSFWGNNLFSTYGVLPFFSCILSIFFKFFGIGNFSIFLVSFTFFISTFILIFLLTKKLTRNSLIAFLSSIVFLFNNDMIEYVKNGASENLFIFQILLGIYLILFKNRWTKIGAFLVIILIYFTRPQAFIYILGIIFFYLLTILKIKKSLIYFGGVIIMCFLIDFFILSIINGKHFLYSITARGINATISHLPNFSVSDSLRGNIIFDIGFLSVFKKVLYNLYNFYKAIPEIMNPYLFGLFVIGLFAWGKDRLQNSFKISVIFMTLATFLVTALTIPFYRYLHPVVPLVYIVGVATLVDIFKDHKYKIIISYFLILIFTVGQTLGIIFLDSRFKAKLVNKDKPPIYAVMSFKLKEITKPDDVIVTNLDTWGSWYGKRKTIWFPLEPSMIIPVEDKIDAIYLTNYLIDDENYYMGENWREIFNNPENQTILKDYKYVGEYEFKAEDNYEKENGKAILLVRN
ncbi:MAG: hypothetical protein QMD92_00500 [bacterium]|nr:hypothetical protein [bacterium]